MSPRDQDVGDGHDLAEVEKLLPADFEHLAKKILQLGKDKDALIHQDVNLAQWLEQLPAEQAIPEEAYRWVAELLTFLSATDKKSESS